MGNYESPKPYLYTDRNDNTEEDYARSILRLKKPVGKIDVVLDTDTFNEVDDQFALAYLIQSDEKLNLKAIYAAPFYNHHSTSPKDGMEKSYDEIFKVLDMIHANEYKDVVFKGADDFLKDEQTPIHSDAVHHLIELSKNYSEENPLYVIGIAAATNLASALLIDPTLKDRVFMIWLGGLGFDWHDNQSFNAGQDVTSARVLLDTHVPVVLIPGRGVLDTFTTTGPELRHWLGGKNKFCDYMIEKTDHEVDVTTGEKLWSRPLSDVAAIGWLLDGNFMLDRIINSPIMQYDHFYSEDKRRQFVKYVYSINRDTLMEDLFKKLSKIK